MLFSDIYFVSLMFLVALFMLFHNDPTNWHTTGNLQEPCSNCTWYVLLSHVSVISVRLFLCFSYIYHRANFTVFILSFWQQLFIYLLNLNLFNSCDSQTVELICFNLIIDFDASRKRAECDVPKTSISCHNIYLIISSILFDVLHM